jgi:hypothetical protein
MGQTVSQISEYTNCCDGRIPFLSSNQVNKTSSSTQPTNFSDYRKFEQARNSSNLATLVQLLSSTEKLPKAYRTASVHPWARAPETIGALVSAHLAVLISTTDVADSLVDLDVTAHLTEFLKSDSPDRVHAASVTLVFLTEKSSLACSLLCDDDVPKVTLDLVSSGGAGFQLTLLSLYRNLAKIKSEILAVSGKDVAFLLTNILSSQLSKRQTPQTNDFVLECLQILSDLVELSAAFKGLVKNDRLESLLEVTKVSEDVDIAEETKRLVTILD